MKIKWLGHAAVLITSDSGTKIITDPFKPGHFVTPDGWLFYDPIKESADVVVVTHDHRDHNEVGEVKGNPQIVSGDEIKGKGPVKVKGIEFRSIPTFHDDCEGKILGENNVLCFEVDGLRICHNGDLGHKLSDEQLAQIGKVDVLLLCVGQLKPIGEPQSRIDDAGKRIRLPYAKYIVDCDAANYSYDQLAPKVTIPIHYSNKRCTFKLAGVESFLLQKKNVTRLDTSEVDIKREKLPAESQIVVLQPAL